MCQSRRLPWRGPSRASSPLNGNPIVGVLRVPLDFRKGYAASPLCLDFGVTHAAIQVPPPGNGRTKMNSSKLNLYLNDPRGPEEILPTMTAEELAHLLDALYQNLDTPEPVFGVERWYEFAFEECRRWAG